MRAAGASPPAASREQVERGADDRGAGGALDGARADEQVEGGSEGAGERGRREDDDAGGEDRDRTAAREEGCRAAPRARARGCMTSAPRRASTSSTSYRARISGNAIVTTDESARTMPTERPSNAIRMRRLLSCGSRRAAPGTSRSPPSSRTRSSARRPRRATGGSRRWTTPPPQPRRSRRSRRPIAREPALDCLLHLVELLAATPTPAARPRLCACSPASVSGRPRSWKPVVRSSVDPLTSSTASCHRLLVEVPALGQRLDRVLRRSVTQLLSSLQTLPAHSSVALSSLPPQPARTGAVRATRARSAARRPTTTLRFYSTCDVRCQDMTCSMLAYEHLLGSAHHRRRDRCRRSRRCCSCGDARRKAATSRTATVLQASSACLRPGSPSCSGSSSSSRSRASTRPGPVRSKRRWCWRSRSRRPSSFPTRPQS